MAKSKHISKQAHQVKQTDKQPTPSEGQDAAPALQDTGPVSEKNTTWLTPDGRTLETDPWKGRVTGGRCPGLVRCTFGPALGTSGPPYRVWDRPPSPERLEAFEEEFLERERQCGVRLSTGGNFWDILVIYNNTQDCDEGMRRNVFRNLAKRPLGDLLEVLPDPIVAPDPDVKTAPKFDPEHKDQVVEWKGRRKPKLTNSRIQELFVQRFGRTVSIATMNAWVKESKK